MFFRNSHSIVGCVNSGKLFFIKGLICLFRGVTGPGHPAAVGLLDGAGYLASRIPRSRRQMAATTRSPIRWATAAISIVNAYLTSVKGAALDHARQAVVGYRIDRAQRTKTRRFVSASGWCPAKGPAASMPCILKSFA
jgi:hypothetical protein